MRERNSNSRIAFQATAGGGERFALVLEFNLLPRKMAAKRSAKDFRRSKRRASASAEDIRGSIENS